VVIQTHDEVAQHATRCRIRLFAFRQSLPVVRVQDVALMLPILPGCYHHAVGSPAVTASFA
jgi:hypothetical protein